MPGLLSFAMFTEIDKILYEPKCQVIATSKTSGIYPIFKNGSSSLYATALQKKWPILFNIQIGKLQNIDIYIREPAERFAAGADTFVSNLLSNNPQLDKATINHFVENYLFLDRHYLPQFFWLINLAQHLDKDCVLTFRSMQDLATFTHRRVNPTESVYPQYDFKNIQMYVTLDRFLLEHLYHSITWDDLYDSFVKNHYDINQYIFNHSGRLQNVLY